MQSRTAIFFGVRKDSYQNWEWNDYFPHVRYRKKVNEFLTFLGKFEAKPKKNIKRVRGYRVKSNFKDIGNTDAHSRNQKIQDIILRKGKDEKKGN
ncbi:MAG: hypothetical protein AAFX55_19755 [Bacteroidota bacterium]